MKIQLVEVTNHDSGWKGTWYKTGERHFVRQDPDWPKVMACKWRALDISGGIHEADCRVVRGPIAWLRCRMRALRSNRAGARGNYRRPPGRHPVSAALRGMPFGIDTANHAGIRIRGYTAEQVAPLLAKSAAYDALVARIEESLIKTVEESGWGDESGDGRVYGIPDRFIGQRVRLLVSDDRPSHAAGEK